MITQLDGVTTRLTGRAAESTVSAPKGRWHLMVLIVLVVLLAATVSTVAAPASTHRHRTSIVIDNWMGDGSGLQLLRHPRRFRVESADSYVVFYKLRWRHWGARHSRGRGWLKVCDYESGCNPRHRAHLLASRRLRCPAGRPDGYSYRRMTTTGLIEYGSTGRTKLPVVGPGCFID